MEIPEYVRRILWALESAGFQAWCVGGCVRDALLGRVPEDWDVTTSALPEQTMALFPHAIPTGLRHGTVTVRQDGTSVEVTTFRRDGDYADHRRPETVSFTGSLEEDLLRRDFTVNAMAMDLRGRIRDPWGGQADLQNRVLRCVGEPDARFEEDALRIMRGLRFSAALGFSFHAATGEALRRKRELLKEIAAQRIQTELWKLLCGRDAANVLRAFPEVPGVFWPELLPMVGFDQRNPHHCYDVWEHTLHALEAVPPEPVLRCAMLLHDIGKPPSFTLDEAGVGHFKGHALISTRMADEMLRRLNCATDFRETVVQLVEWHDLPIPAEPRPVRRALRRLGETELRRLIAVKRADNLAQSPAFQGRQQTLSALEAVLDAELERDACFSLKQLAVKGDDLLAMGMTGPAIGQALNALLEQVMDGALPNDRTALLAALEPLKRN